MNNILEFTNTLSLKKRLTMFPYQELIVSDILNNFNSSKPYVLGACPNSGKTEMAIEVIIRLIETDKINRVLILAHSTNVLKENFYNRLMEYFEEGETIDIMRGQNNYNYDARIQVMIPQNINHISGEFDLIITDEAQHNVLAENGNYNKIVELVNPKFQLLLTGTPSKFILQNNFAERDLLPLSYNINAVGMDKIGLEHFHDVRFDLIKSAYGFTNDDYNNSQNISDLAEFTFADTRKTVNNVIVGVVRNIALRNGIVLPKDSDFVLEGRKLIQSGYFGKTLIMCRNIQQATQVSKIIGDLFKVKVGLSHSKEDNDSANLTRFQEDKFQFLCVVNRAREGYNDKKIVNLIDITMTHNIDLIYQMFCRVVRLDKDYNKSKLYIKVTSNAEGMPDYTMNIMTAALMLGATENLSIFNGNNFRGLIMPRVIRDIENEDEVSVSGNIQTIGSENENEVTGNRRINDLMALDLINIFNNDNEKLINGNERYAMTTLGESLTILRGDNFYSDKEGYFKLFRENNVISGDNWLLKYKNLKEITKLKLHSAPWILFNMSGKDFFIECYPDKGYIDFTLDDYVNFCRQEKLTGNTYPKKYKELSNRDNVNYYSEPWVLFNMSGKDFFNKCYSRNPIYRDKEGYFKLFRENNVINGNQWFNIYNNFKLPNHKLSSQPWRYFNQKQKEFFDECYPNVKISKEDYINLFRENKISSNKWLSGLWKVFSEKNNLNYLAAPWQSWGQSQSDFTNEVFLKKTFYDDKLGYFDLFKKHKISGSTSWEKIYKQLSENDKINYRARPWNFFYQTVKEFFNEYRIWCEKNNFKHFIPWKDKFPRNKEIYFDLIKLERIASERLWKKRYNDLRDRDRINYHSRPWIYFNQTIKEFFEEYREWLKLNFPKTNTKQAYIGAFSEMNKLWNTTNSKQNHKRLNKNKTEWYKYHELYSKSRAKWSEIPYKEISKKIKVRPDWIIGDFGCGENLLSKEIPNKTHSFDHVSINENVVSCDLSCVPLHNEVLDVVVFSLALMGTNYKEYLKEAYRTLKPMGLVLIAEPCTRWEDKEDELKTKLEDVGFKINGDIKHSDRFIYVDAIKY